MTWSNGFLYDFISAHITVEELGPTVFHSVTLVHEMFAGS